MRALKYGIPFLFLAATPLGFLLGGAWSFTAIAVLPLAMLGLDQTLGDERELSFHDGGATYRLLPWLYIGLQIAVDIWAAIAVAEPGTSFVEALGLTLSVGVTTGVFGILAAHEMVHSPLAWERGLGLTLLATVGYMHFRIAHIHGHHVRGATRDDPATARRGETVYAFVVRSVIGQAREAWDFEAARLTRRGRPIFGLANRMLLYVGVEISIVLALCFLGLRALAFWFAQAVLAIVLLELFNYIAHYGLERRRRPDGVFERIAPEHSWNSMRRMNNCALFNMGRHSDHHRRPTSPYQRLEAEPDAPQLPFGYAGAILCALLPPLWRSRMDPRVDALAQTGAALADARRSVVTQRSECIGTCVEF
jgi:alkane 1-monooxygenase